LARLAAVASAGDPRAQAVFRDELIGFYRAAAEISWRELRRAINDLDRMTRGPDGAEYAQRRHRVKP
jgi:uncharacterized protein YjiS (DUF1127 family)